MTVIVHLHRTASTIVVGVAVLCCSVATSRAAAGPFAMFGGTWRGGGTVEMTDGSREAIRCKAAYGVDATGDRLSIDVDCASDSFRVHILSAVVAQGDGFSGQWEETTRQIQGGVAGTMTAPGRMQASFDAMGGGLQLGATTNGRRQAITIRSQGTDVQGVTIVLKR